MQHYRRLLMVAILAWSASAVAVRAEDEGSSVVSCNAFCRFWLGRGADQNETSPTPPPPVAAAEAPSPIQAAPQPEEPEVQPRVRLKGNRSRTTARALPVIQQPAKSPVEEGQGVEPGAPSASPPPSAAAMSRPMDLTPEQAADSTEPPAQARPIPMPPRPLKRSRQAQAVRSKRPVPARQVSPGVVPSQELRPASSDTGVADAANERARKGPASPASKPPVTRLIAVAPSPAPPPLAVPATPPASLAPAAKATLAEQPPAEVSGLRGSMASLDGRTLQAPDTHRSLPERLVPVLDPRRLHDVAPGPRTAEAVQTSSMPRAPARPARADPEEAFEDLKATIMRSAQEALKQSEVHGF